MLTAKVFVIFIPLDYIYKGIYYAKFSISALTWIMIVDCTVKADIDGQKNISLRLPSHINDSLCKYTRNRKNHFEYDDFP